jgi:hypothetical protein
MVAEMGETETVTVAVGALIVTSAEADLVASATLVAVISTGFVLGTALGAV